MTTAGLTITCTAETANSIAAASIRSHSAISVSATQSGSKEAKSPQMNQLKETTIGMSMVLKISDYL